MLHRLLHDLHDLVGEPGCHFLQGRNLLLGLPGGLIGDLLQLHRRNTRQGVVERGPESIDIRPVIFLGVLEHLRGHVGGGGPDLVGANRSILRQQRQPEVHQFGCLILVDEDISRLDIPMDEPRTQGSPQSVHNLQRQPDYRILRQSSVHRHALVQTLPRDEFHCDEVTIEGSSHLVDPYHIGMTDRGSEPGLALELLFTLLVRGKLFVQHLDRNVPVQGEIAGHEHHAHPPEGDAPDKVVGPHLGLHPHLLPAFRAAHAAVGPHVRHIHLARAIRTGGQVRAHRTKVAVAPRR